MDLDNLKEKLRSASPLELLRKLKENLTALWSGVFSSKKGSPGFPGDSDEALQDEPSPLARKKRLILFGLGGAAVLLFGLLITIIFVNAKPKNTGAFNISSGLSIPAEEFFFPSEPDFLPGFLPEREPRRFWTLDDIRPYWKTPGNTDWWMDEIISTVDNLMEGIP
jgi:hypothetical protein